MGLTEWVSNIVPQLNQSCCGCTLRTGSIIIGWFEAICGTLAFLSYVKFLLGVSPSEEERETVIAKAQSEEPKLVLIVAAILCLLLAVFAIFLLLGIYQKRRSYYRLWITYTIIFWALNVLGLISTITGTFRAHVFVSAVLGICLHGYFFLVVYSDLRQMKAQDHGGPS